MRHFNKDTHPKTPDGQFACTHCKGKGYLEWEHARLNNLGENPTRTDCIFCDKTGYYVVELHHELQYKENQINHEHEEFEILRDWILKNSTCKTCGGNQMKTMGIVKCEECGLEGRCPWGG